MWGGERGISLSHSGRECAVDDPANADPLDASVMNLEHVLKANSEDTSRARLLTERFLSANGLRTASNAGEEDGGGEGSDGGLSPAARAHEAYNTAYTLKVLASNMKLSAAAVVTTASAAEGTHQRFRLPLDGAVATETVEAVVKALCRRGHGPPH